MVKRDEWARRAHAEGYRSRAAYKLRQLDDEFDLLASGATVVDLGGAPGGWMQVAADAVGEEGTVIGVDRRPIEAIEDAPATVHRLQGDVTDATVRERILETAGDRVDVVLSDMSPDISGEYQLDHARSIGLAEAAREAALALLTTGGAFVVKVFDGRDLAAFRASLEGEFARVATARPRATRDASSEVYLVATGRLTAPIRPGETHTVTIVDTGSEGDGVAKIEGFTVFVPGVAEGSTLDIEIVDVKPTFGFGEPLDG